MPSYQRRMRDLAAERTCDRLKSLLGLGAVDDLTLIVFSTTERWIAAAS